MRVSKNIVNTEIDNKVVVLSTISMAVIEFTKDEYKNFNNENENEVLFDDSTKKFLIDNYFLIEKNIDDEIIKIDILNKSRVKPETFSTYIAFSTMCNFSCTYCYEKGQIKCNKILNDDDLIDIISWYDKIIREHGYKVCKVILYGGEPLLNQKKIKKFISKLKEVTKACGTKLKLGIITNGYLLNNDIISFLDENGLEEIQITLDGIGEVHDARRPLKNGGPTFKIIINNLQKMNKISGRILIRISFDKSNIDDVKKLIAYLKSIELKNELELYFAPIHQTTDQKKDLCSFCNVNVFVDTVVIENLYKELYLYAKENGFYVPEHYFNGPCMVVASDSVLIGPDKNLYKCVEMIDIDELCVGKIDRNTEFNYKIIYHEFMENDKIKTCIEKKCKYLLMCSGGCVMKKYLSEKKINVPDCEYRLIEGLNKFLLDLYYREEV